jgi:hypothetical protein
MRDYIAVGAAPRGGAISGAKGNDDLPLSR